MKKPLIVFFSPTGRTKREAEDLAAATGGDLYEIRPAVPYTAKDLNWMDQTARSTIEMHDPSSRPALADRDAPVAEYDTIFVGFPIWWYIAPTIINSFLESYDFSGKKIVLFATSGGSGFGKAKESLQKSAPNALIEEGQLMNNHPSADEIHVWADAKLED